MYVRFEPLPAERRSQWAHDVADMLRQRTGEWACIADNENPNRASNLAHRIRSGQVAAFRPAGVFEARSRTVEDGTACVYARHIGGPRTAAADAD
ncbi:hypothetical protein [Streptomyces olivoreticuli]|uniref:hypothetical protein n=1 Tax=Streptomyces olivoreticuli TaxID=68246 RepID=UPI000E26CC5A|nr:hypothetical protein [Streptomyces olivoreticuli]